MRPLVVLSIVAAGACTARVGLARRSLVVHITLLPKTQPYAQVLVGMPFCDVMGHRTPSPAQWWLWTRLRMGPDPGS